MPGRRTHDDDLLQLFHGRRLVVRACDLRFHSVSLILQEEDRPRGLKIRILPLLVQQLPNRSVPLVTLALLFTKERVVITNILGKTLLTYSPQIQVAGGGSWWSPASGSS